MPRYKPNVLYKYFVILFVLISFSIPNLVLSATKPKRVVPVGVAKAVTKSPSTTIKLPGTVIPSAITHIASEIDGRVSKLYFLDGQHVKAGTLLVQMRITPLKLQLELAKAEKKLVLARLKELETGTRQESIDTAKYAFQQAKAKLELADIELERVKKLSDDGVLSRGEYDNAKATAEEAEAKVKEQQSILDELSEGPRIEKIDQEKAILEAAEARINIIQDEMRRGSIYAPFSGYIIKKETEVGQWLEKGDSAVSMISDNSLNVEVALPQSSFSKVHIGSSAKINLESYESDKSDRTYKGKVIEIIRVGDPVSRAFPIRVKIIKPDKHIAVGMLVNVEIYTKVKSKSMVYVPKDSIVRTPKETMVWVVRPDKDNLLVTHKIVVQVGKHDGSLVAVDFIKGQIKSNERVVVKGNERLKPNSQVNIIEQNN
jgi:RND family efflux transporter MFP subunit